MENINNIIWTEYSDFIYGKSIQKYSEKIAGFDMDNTII
jgi:hypothetical protein